MFSYNQHYKKEYVEYKEKYLALKQQLLYQFDEANQKANQKGGLSSLTIEKDNRDYLDIQANAKKHMILLAENQHDVLRKIKESKQGISDKLDNLLKWVNKGINIDFINDFYNLLPYDLEDENAKYNMYLSMTRGKFDHEEKMAYRIKGEGIVSGGGDIYFLEKKEGINDGLPDELVLKVFTDEELNNISSYLPINFYKILSDNPKGSNILNLLSRYSKIGSDSFDARNYNSLDKTVDFIKSRRDDEFIIP
jgi:hypothetical protein